MTHRNAWIGDLVASASGIVQRSDGRVAIGAVLLIENAAGEIVVVTKAPKPGYEFSGSDTLPGGMLRSACAGPIRPDDLRRIAFESLSMRASAEAGYLPESAPAVIELNPPPTTSYTVGGARKHVVVLPYAITAPQGFHPVASDRSVTTARWVNPLEVIPNLAPANCIVVCKFIWPRLDAALRGKCRASIGNAAADCKRWAQEAGVPPVDMAWLSGTG
jgi:8-oxo-dGTP pyrophosphatase MutT (NUDIX family)